jgi:hypothetical protein
LDFSVCAHAFGIRAILSRRRQKGQETCDAQIDNDILLTPRRIIATADILISRSSP